MAKKFLQYAVACWQMRRGQLPPLEGEIGGVPKWQPQTFAELLIKYRSLLQEFIYTLQIQFSNAQTEMWRCLEAPHLVEL